MARRLSAAVPVLALALLLTGCSGGGDSFEGAEPGGEMDTAGEELAQAEDGQAGGAEGGGDEQAGGGEGGGDEQADVANAPAGPRAGVGAAAGDGAALPDVAPSVDRIIKEGTVRVEVPAGRFDDAFARVISAARRHGGDVLSSSTHNEGDGPASGSLTLRVPARNFEDLLVGVAGIGTIRGRDIQASDVSVEYVDLQSRLRHLEAQERFYLGLLERAQAVGDAIAVQQQLEGIQAQIEQVKGRLRYLDERTTYSTLTVELFESGATVTRLSEHDPARPSLSRYWASARDAFVNMLGGLLVAASFLLPLLVVAALVGLLAAVALRRRTPAPVAEDSGARERVGAGR